MTNILMIEDDLELAEITAEYLEKFDMKVDIAHEPYIGLSKLCKIGQRVPAGMFNFLAIALKVSFSFASNSRIFNTLRVG